MKTPEQKPDCVARQMAEEYAFKFYLNEDSGYAMTMNRDAFLAGYQAGRLNSEGVQAAKDQLADASKVMPQWISVKDRLPEVGKEILWYHEPGEEFAIGLLHYGVEKPFFTHWMPLPKLPENS